MADREPNTIDEQPCEYCEEGLCDYGGGQVYMCEYCDGSGLVLVCGTCGKPLQPVRPGKWQCNSKECN